VISSGDSLDNTGRVAEGSRSAAFDIFFEEYFDENLELSSMRSESTTAGTVLKEVVMFPYLNRSPYGKKREDLDDRAGSDCIYKSRS
jgi:hypothetical protein